MVRSKRASVRRRAKHAAPALRSSWTHSPALCFPPPSRTPDLPGAAP